MYKHFPKSTPSWYNKVPKFYKLTWANKIWHLAEIMVCCEKEKVYISRCIRAKYKHHFVLNSIFLLKNQTKMISHSDHEWLV